MSTLPGYLADARAVVRYSPETPDGALQMGVAENQMVEDMLVPALSKFQADSFDPGCIYYQPTQGRESLRKAFCGYLERTLRLSRRLDPDGLIIGSGCNAVLENLCFALAEVGDAVLIPTPYYAAFEFDLVARAGLSVVPVRTFEHSGVDLTVPIIPEAAYYPTEASLNAALEAAKVHGHRPRILLLSHPNNPLGVCYPADVVQTCINWSRDNGIHIISDEIYAGSVHGNSKNGGKAFTSALELAGDELGPFVHLVYALSKDFALSGLRVGACYTENDSARFPLQKLNDLCQVSSHTQVLVETLLTAQDDGGNGTFWTDGFLLENQRRIRSRCQDVQSLLDSHGIPFLSGTGGLFLWMDFSRYLPPKIHGDPSTGGDSLAGGFDSGKDNNENNDSERERYLYLKLMNEYGLLFTPGLSMRNELPGFFRFVFTAGTDEEFALALERIDRFAKETPIEPE